MDDVIRALATAKREHVAKVAALTRSVDQGCEMVTRLSLKLNELEAELAKVTAKLDEARSCAAEMRDSLHDAQPSIEEGPSEWMPLTWERATPTEGDLPIEPSDTPKGGE
jgi:phage shock protein A